MTDALKLFVDACGGNPPDFLREAYAAAENAIEQNQPALDQERDWMANEARRYAGFYPEASDGRNTFIMFAEMIESRIGSTPLPSPS
jgi:hypothetical protein